MFLHTLRVHAPTLDTAPLLSSVTDQFPSVVQNSHELFYSISARSWLLHLSPTNFVFYIHSLHLHTAMLRHTRQTPLISLRATIESFTALFCSKTDRVCHLITPTNSFLTYTLHLLTTPLSYTSPTFLKLLSSPQKCFRNSASKTARLLLTYNARFLFLYTLYLYTTLLRLTSQTFLQFFNATVKHFSHF